MNKNLFLGLFAAASMLFATSCSNDELEAVQSGNEAKVTFSLGLENGIGSRAEISDGSGATKLIYAVYKINSTTKLAELQNVVGSTNGQFVKTDFKSGDNVSVTLAKGQTYQVAFWAQNPNSSAYNTTDLTKVGVNYQNATNNNESRDAFFKTVEFTVTGSTSIDVVMKRPFAQINVGVTDVDWNAAVGSGIEIAKSSATIKNAANEINLLDGSVKGSVEVKYGLQNIPTETLEVDIDKDGTIEENEKYHWLSMSYILPADGNSGYEKTTLDNINFVFAPKSGNSIEFKEGLNAVPVQRNWRTNILGKLLTGDITFNIVIDPIYENDHNVMVPYASINGVAYATFAEAMAAVQDGETIKLEGETTLDGVANSKLFTVNKNITIDLNGYGFVANMPDVTVNSSIFEVVTGGELTIIGEGNVKFVTKSAPNNVAAFINNLGGTVNLKGGNWTISEIGGYALLPTFVDNNSNTSSVTLNIYGGTYTFNRNLFRNFANAASHNNYATVATINIYGGTFNCNESSPGRIWNQKPSADVNIPASAGVINVKGGTFNNVVINDQFGGVVYIDNKDEFVGALANVNTHTIYLGAGEFVADIYNGTPGRKSLTIIGSEGTKFGHTATTGGQLRLDLFDSFTIRNCEIIQRSGYKTWGHIVFGSGNKANGVYTIENCKFNGIGTQGIYINENTTGATYNILNCTFDGNFGTEGAITIQTNKDVNHTVNVKGCTFNNIPATSHRIFLAKSTAGLFYDFTLNTDLQVSSDYEIENLIKLGSENIYLPAGTYTMPKNEFFSEGVTLVCEENTVFEGKSGLNINGATIVGATFSDPTTAVAGTLHGTFKDCVFEGSEALRWCYSEVGKPVVFENCEIKTDFRGFHFDNMKGDVIFRNCKINGFNAYGGEGTITFEGCTFGNDDSSYNGLNIYANTILKDCKFVFKSGKTNFIDLEGIGKTLSITNCTATLDGAAADIKNYIGGSKKDQNTITLNGVTL